MSALSIELASPCLGILSRPWNFWTNEISKIEPFLSLAVANQRCGGRVRARSVVTIEEDADWHAELRQRVPANVTLAHIPVDHVSRDVSKVAAFLDTVGIAEFDIIAIDGHLRTECGGIALPRLKRGGAAILDNSEGYGFRDFTIAENLQRIDFYGFAGGASRQSCTSIAYRNECFLLDPRQPLVAID